MTSNIANSDAKPIAFPILIESGFCFLRFPLLSASDTPPTNNQPQRRIAIFYCCSCSAGKLQILFCFHQQADHLENFYEIIASQPGGWMNVGPKESAGNLLNNCMTWRQFEQMLEMNNLFSFRSCHFIEQSIHQLKGHYLNH